MEELAIIEDKSAMTQAVETVKMYEQQIKTMESEVKRIKSLILKSMQDNNIKTLEIVGHKFNRIMPEKKKLREDDATNYLIEKDLLQDFQVLDTKKVMSAFPEFVEVLDGTEYLSITELKEQA